LSGAEPPAAAARARAVLEADLDALTRGLDLPAGAIDRLERYVELLLAANMRMNLTRVVDPDAVARLHLLDALAALPILDELGPHGAVDLGSGGGVPGIPLAIARPDRTWLLVESVTKKADFLRETAAALGLDNVTVANERAESLGRQARHRERADLVTARACAPLPVLAELAMPLLAPGGRLVAWKGPLAADDPELRRGNRALAQLGGGAAEILPALPDPGGPLGGHTFVRATKEQPTPSRYPRRPGEPGRRPLA
jgi:16S rRNA (guanine527-N7)-methyltransferase